MTDISAIRGDITDLDVDAIVNAANNRLAGGGGVDGAIHRAGGPSIAAECTAWVKVNGPLATGDAMVTGGGRLRASHVIHAVGPVWGSRGPEVSKSLLSQSYESSLDLAASIGARSVAFPNISTGIYGFPARPAAEIAVATVSNWVAAHPDTFERVLFVCFTEENWSLYSEMLAG